MSRRLNEGNAALFSSPVTIARAVTLTDNTALPNGVCDAIYVGAAGNLALVLEDDITPSTDAGGSPTMNPVTFVALLAGQVYPFRCRSINSTNSTASSVVALYHANA